MMSFSVESIRAVSGVNLEFLGMADRDQPGVLEFHRKQAAINVIASFFDGLRKYRKERARCVLHFIREYVPDGKIIRIMGEKGIEQFVKFVKDPAIEDFDVIVDESPQSPNQRDRTFAILREMIPGLIQAGVPIPPEILDYAPLPSGLVAAWKKMIVERTQGDPAQKQLMQQMAQLETALKQATISKTEAEAERAAADAEKKRAEVEKVEAETDLTEVRAAVEPSRALPNPPTQRAAE